MTVAKHLLGTLRDGTPVFEHSDRALIDALRLEQEQDEAEQAADGRNGGEVDVDDFWDKRAAEADPAAEPVDVDDHHAGAPYSSELPASQHDSEDGTDPLYSDVAALLDGTLPEPPKPVLLTRTDGHALFYAGRVNVFFGDPEVGKTWVALAACVEALRSGRRVLFMDLDHNGIEAIVANLLLLGAPVSAMRDPDVFRHCEPNDVVEVRQVVADCEVWRPAVAVVDSLGELLPMMGMSSNSSDEYTLANARVLQPLADAGAAVVAIDHLAKNFTSRAAGPTGAVAKRRALGGAAIRVKAGRQFVPGKGGSALLIVNKDRHGGVRRHCPSGEREPLAGTFVMDPADSNGAVGWRVLPPLEMAVVATSLDDKALDYLRAARALAMNAFTAKDLAVAMPGVEVPATESQVKQAARYGDKLTEAGLFERVEKGRRGGAATRWQLAEPNPEIKSQTPLWEPNPAANPAKSEEP
jgi:hypothetical protein